MFTRFYQILMRDYLAFVLPAAGDKEGVSAEVRAQCCSGKGRSNKLLVQFVEQDYIQVILN